MKSEIQVVNLDGKQLENLSFETAPKDWSRLFAQYLRVISFGQRRGQAKTQTRGEVSGGGKKPWKQKGTGRARQGSIRSPIWRGGGVAHGPKPRSYALKFNKGYMPKVWAYVLSKAAQKSAGWLVLRTDERKVKTKNAAGFLKKFGENGRRILLVCEDENIRRAFRNIESLQLSKIEDVSPYDVTTARTLITGEKDFEYLKKKAKA